MYKVGAVGLGHWFLRLYAGLSGEGELQITKAVGTKPAVSKAELLDKLGISYDNYFKVEPDESVLPGGFLDDLDVVHISNPNQFHAAQTLQTLMDGKIAVVEKTFGVNKQEFENVFSQIRKNGLRNKTYLHLHYVHKLLTLQMPALLDRLTEQHGKITGGSLTFFENRSEEDSRRKAWLFTRESGGIFMDWIHAFELLYQGALADSVDLENVELYAVNKEYGGDPTGVFTCVNTKGKNFARGAICNIRIAKGIEHNKMDGSKKKARFLFEDGAALDLNFLDSEEEFHSENRGSWQLLDKLYGEMKVVESQEPHGPTSSQLFARDIVRMCNGERAGLTLEEITKLFEVQWKYQELTWDKKPESKEQAVNRFVQDGLDCMVARQLSSQ